MDSGMEKLRPEEGRLRKTHAESLPLPFCVALKSWMALGTKDFLSLSDEHDSDRSLPLKMLLCPLRVLCSGWWSLSKMVSSLLNGVERSEERGREEERGRDERRGEG